MPVSLGYLRYVRESTLVQMMIREGFPLPHGGCVPKGPWMTGQIFSQRHFSVAGTEMKQCGSGDVPDRDCDVRGAGGYARLLHHQR